MVAAIVAATVGNGGGLPLTPISCSMTGWSDRSLPLSLRSLSMRTWGERHPVPMESGAEAAAGLSTGPVPTSWHGAGREATAWPVCP